MSVDDLIALCERRMVWQSALRAEADRLGDSVASAALDAEMSATLSTLEQLRSL